MPSAQKINGRVYLLPPNYFAQRTPMDIRIALETSFSPAQKATLSVQLHWSQSLVREIASKSLAVGVGRQVVSLNLPPLSLYAPEGLAEPDEVDLRIVCSPEESCHTWEHSERLIYLPVNTLSPQLLGGLFIGLYHWSEREARLWNKDLQRFSSHDWAQLVRSYHRIGIKTLVIQESWRSDAYVGKHDFGIYGYNGMSYYPSKLGTRRVEIATEDPLQVILAQAQNFNMKVFVPVGLYAWFDFSEDSLKWHKEVMQELWERYGHFSSFAGWYVSEEVHGNLGETENNKYELIKFFSGLKAFSDNLTPGAPLMLASNCHHISDAGSYYFDLFQSLDILTPFGFQRMPSNDLTPEEAALQLITMAQASNKHVWLDLELFDFGPDMELIPREGEDITAELQTLNMFEHIIGYQGPGILTDPSWPIQLGGIRAAKLYEFYHAYYSEMISKREEPAAKTQA